MEKINIQMDPRDLSRMIEFIQTHKDSATQEQLQALGGFTLAALLASLDGAITALKARNALEIKPAVLREVNDEHRFGPDDIYEYTSNAGDRTIFVYNRSTEYDINGKPLSEDTGMPADEDIVQVIPLGDLLLARLT